MSGDKTKVKKDSKGGQASWLEEARNWGCSANNNATDATKRTTRRLESETDDKKFDMAAARARILECNRLEAAAGDERRVNTQKLWELQREQFVNDGGKSKKDSDMDKRLIQQKLETARRVVQVKTEEERVYAEERLMLEYQLALVWNDKSLQSRIAKSMKDLGVGSVITELVGIAGTAVTDVIQGDFLNIPQMAMSKNRGKTIKHK